MNGGQLYWGLQGLYMKVEFSSLTLPFHRTTLLNHLRLVGGYEKPDRSPLLVISFNVYVGISL